MFRHGRLCGNTAFRLYGPTHTPIYLQITQMDFSMLICVNLWAVLREGRLIEVLGIG